MMMMPKMLSKQDYITALFQIRPILT